MEIAVSLHNIMLRKKSNEWISAYEHRAVECFKKLTDELEEGHIDRYTYLYFLEAEDIIDLWNVYAATGLEYYLIDAFNIGKLISEVHYILSPRSSRRGRRK